MMGARCRSKKKRGKGESTSFCGKQKSRMTSLIAFLYKEEEEDKVMMWHYDMVPLIQAIARYAFIPNMKLVHSTTKFCVHLTYFIETILRFALDGNV